MNMVTKMKNLLVILVMAIIIFLFVGIFTVNQNQVAVVSNNYTTTQQIYTAGIHWYTPIWQNVDYVYTNNRSSVVSLGDNLLTQDKQSVTMSLLVSWEVIDPIAYLSKQKMPDGDVNLSSVITKEIRAQIESLVATSDLSQLNDDITLISSINTELAKYGIKITVVDTISLWSNTLLANNSMESIVIQGNVSTQEESSLLISNSIQSTITQDDITTQPNMEMQQKFAVANSLSIESAFNEANRIKTDTAIQEAQIYKEIRAQNPKLYNYMRQMDVYRQTSKSKADIPPLGKLYP